MDRYHGFGENHRNVAASNLGRGLNHRTLHRIPRHETQANRARARPAGLRVGVGEEDAVMSFGWTKPRSLPGLPHAGGPRGMSVAAWGKYLARTSHVE